MFSGSCYSLFSAQRKWNENFLLYVYMEHMYANAHTHTHTHRGVGEGQRKEKEKGRSDSPFLLLRCCGSSAVSPASCSRLMRLEIGDELGNHEIQLLSCKSKTILTC